MNEERHEKSAKKGRGRQAVASWGDSSHTWWGTSWRHSESTLACTTWVTENYPLRGELRRQDGGQHVPQTGVRQGQPLHPDTEGDGAPDRVRQRQEEALSVYLKLYTPIKSTLTPTWGRLSRRNMELDMSLFSSQKSSRSHEKAE